MMISKPDLYKIFLASEDRLKVRTYSNMLLKNSFISGVKKNHLIVEEIKSVNLMIPVHISIIMEVSKNYVNGIFKKDVGKERYIEFSLPKQTVLIKHTEFNHIFLPSLRSVLLITHERSMGDS